MRRSALVVLVAALVAAFSAPSFAVGRPEKDLGLATVEWAPADAATIHPGVQTFTDGAQCTANFVFIDAAGDVFIGQAAHCAGTGGATETDGCDAESLPLGTTVEVDGASGSGTLVYSSWITMRNRGERDESTCGYNDFALVKLDPADHGNVNPSVPAWGGPVSVGATSAFGDKVYSFGNSSLRFGAAPLSPKEGYSLGQDRDGWNHQVYTATPGIPGDSGSAFLSSDGAALGTLSTVALLPFSGSNGVSDLAHELAYAQNFGGFSGLELARGTEPFQGGVLP